MIIGPSHVVRWKRLKDFFEIDSDFFGIGGLPIWHNVIQCQSKAKNPFIMVGDFRFGNAFHLTQIESDAFIVKKDLITPEIDRLMYEKSIKSLEHLERSDVRLVFWCLFIREYKNIEGGKYFKNDVYQHPIWNLRLLERKFKNSIKLSEVIDQDLDFLFIDSSNHPSTFGYYFLKKIYEGVPPTKALTLTLQVKKTYFAIFDFFNKDRFIVSGTTSTFRLIKDYLNRGILETKKIGGFHIREADEALFSSHKYHKNLIYFAKEEDSKPQDATLTFFDKAPYQNKLLVIKKDGGTFFYKAHNQEKPTLYFVMKHRSEEEEIVGDIYNLIGLTQVIYFSMSILTKDGLIKTNPYSKLKTLLS
ncbi:hypothetical protein B8W72_05615 [Pseudomonas putida]|uniref:Uncharacterized protein n=1 Tax=Pseudomonas putida TaxID=303 RepID=A0A1Y3LFS2_PSEPU|nr:hypothetical protein [Pseudomonas putida]OUM36989.1 hypothetical protein B8W72_05615 [Pseudomonas putida]